MSSSYMDERGHEFIKGQHASDCIQCRPKETLTGHECPECGSEGPHTYWPGENLAECSAGCLCEFNVTGGEK